MIGIFRPLRGELSAEEFRIVSSMHCMGCRAGKEFQGRLSTTFYPYETDFFLLIAHGILLSGRNARHPEFESIGCTLFPPYRKNIPVDQFGLKEKAAAFSTVMIFAVLDDKIRDDGKAWLRFFRDRYLAGLPKGLSILGIEEFTPPDPRLLATLDERAVSSVREYLDLFDPFVRDLWVKSFKSIPLPLPEEYVLKLSKNLGDIMLLVDIISDYEEDLESRQFNPLGGYGDIDTSLRLLESLTSETALLLRKCAEPYKGILINILTKGIHSVITKRREKYDTRRSNQRIEALPES